MALPMLDFTFCLAHLSFIVEDLDQDYEKYREVGTIGIVRPTELNLKLVWWKSQRKVNENQFVNDFKCSINELISSANKKTI